MGIADSGDIWSAIIGAGASIAGSAIAGGGRKKTREMQMAMYKENLRRQHIYQQNIWRREDSATQRKVADLRSAGISPTQAVGGGVQGSTVSPGVDTAGFDPGESPGEKVGENLGEVAKSALELKSLAMRLMQQRKDIELADGTITLNRKEQLSKDIKNAFDFYEYSKGVESGLGKDSMPTLMKYTLFLNNQLDKALKGIKGNASLKLLQDVNELTEPKKTPKKKK